jgi:hypothetical protein
MRESLCVVLAGAFLLSLLMPTSVPGIAAQTASTYVPPLEEALEQRARRLLQPNPGNYLVEIDRRLQSLDFAGAEALATAAIDMNDEGGNPELQAYIRSLAFLRRADARRQLGRPEEFVNADVAAAADLGNLVAIRQLVRQYGQTAIDKKPSSARDVPGVDIDKVLTAGFDLGDAATLQAVALGFGSAFDARQRMLSKLLFDIRSNDPDFVRTVGALRRKPDLEKLLREIAFVGGPISYGPDRRPGRDVLATLFAEMSLRVNLARRLGRALPETQNDPPMSLREIIEMNNWLGDASGLATVYHFVPERANLGPRVLEMSRMALASAIGAGDTVHVRCGALAHTAVIWSVNRGRDELVLMDPLFQYWQPSHNDCVTTFSLFHFRYGYYFTRLSFKEVLPLVDAVESVRTYEPPALFGQLGASPEMSRAISAEILRKPETRCSGSGDATKRLIGQPGSFVLVRASFTPIYFSEEGSEKTGNSGLTSHLFLPLPLQFRGKAALVMRTDAEGCARSLSLFLRRSFLASSNVARDLLESFLTQAFGAEEINAWPIAAASEGNLHESPRARVSAIVLRDSAAAVTLKGRRLTAYVGNGISETGARWVRVDGW